MVNTNDTVGGILGIRSVNGDRDKPGQERRAAKALKKPGKDSVDISSRARRLADIENFLAEDDSPEDEGRLPHVKE